MDYVPATRRPQMGDVSKVLTRVDAQRFAQKVRANLRHVGLI